MYMRINNACANACSDFLLIVLARNGYSQIWEGGMGGSSENPGLPCAPGVFSVCTLRVETGRAKCVAYVKSYSHSWGPAAVDWLVCPPCYIAD